MLKLDKISIKKGDFVLQNINLHIERGDYFVLLGKSGAGKTVLLEIIAGIIKPDSGKVFLGEKDITFERVQKRKLGIVFQDNTLFTHLNVKQNVLYSLKRKQISNKEKQYRLQKYVKLLDIEQLLHRNTQQLSGGEIQRVILARTLISEPDCLLLDEPLSSMDIDLKEELKGLLKKINNCGVSILHITHDYSEAHDLSNKVAVLHDAEIIQKGLTQEVFKKPSHPFVARFASIPNFFTYRKIDSKHLVLGGKKKIRIPGGIELSKEEGKIILFERKSQLMKAENNCHGIIAKIQSIKEFPEEYQIILNADILLSVRLSKDVFCKKAFKENDMVSICLSKDSFYLY